MHYKSFEELYGKQITEEHRPSLKDTITKMKSKMKITKIKHTMPFYNTCDLATALPKWPNNDLENKADDHKIIDVKDSNKNEQDEDLDGTIEPEDSDNEKKDSNNNEKEEHKKKGGFYL